MSYLGWETAFQALITTALHHEHGFIRIEAINSLARVGDARAILILKEMQQNDDWNTRNYDNFYAEFPVKKAALEAIKVIEESQ